MFESLFRLLRAPKKERTRYFDKVYGENKFHGAESLSGEGSSKEATTIVRQELPRIIKRYNIKTILDLPCGDLNWMKFVLEKNKSISYTGADVSLIAVKNNQKKFPQLQFLHLDAVSTKIKSSYDLIFCRDLFVHLPNSEIDLCLKNFKNSGSRWLLTTTFIDRPENIDLVYSETIVEWRPINLEKAPFFLLKPEYLFLEECTEGNGNYTDKAMALYDLRKLTVC